MMTIDKHKSTAAEGFASKWSGTGYEKGDTQKFWLELLQKVLGVEDPYSFVEFEDKVMVDNTNFMDVYLPATRVLIEQKSIDKNLGAPIHQSDGALLNPFQQAKKYIVGLPLSRHPRWVVTCNFAEFWVYDMEQPNGEPQKIMLKDLGKEYHRLQFLVDQKSEHISKEMQVSMQAGEIVGRIYDALSKQYTINNCGTQLPTMDNCGTQLPTMLRWLNILCVRIVFCLYAEDAGVFAHDQFHDYLASTNTEDMREALLKLFDTLNKPVEKRSPYLKPSLAAFPYTNGGLFAEEIEIPQFTDELKKTLLDNASLDFDWSEISPTIFGAVFESTLNPETRRSGGMHYTSIENIHKVIDPLFLNDLRRELDEILDIKVERERKKKLDAYQVKLASLTFLDPACGSGNFLTETYLSLRRLENEAIIARHHGQSFLGFEEANPIKVSINQFYGIEINDFAVTVATTALWISEAQMLRETEKIVQHDIDFLPLKSYSNIREGNALKMNWATLNEPQKINAIYTEQLNVYKTDSLGASEPEVKYGTINKEIDVVAKDVVYKNIEDIQQREQEPIDYDYIIGNPPFVGYSLQSKEQKEETLSVFVDHDGKPYKGAGKIDYVANWFFKAAQFVFRKRTRCAFVATNSITQGEQVAAIWKPLYERFGIHIDFAYRTFRWDSESDSKAHVHCVVVGFSGTDNKNSEKMIFSNANSSCVASNINPYLIEAENVWIESRNKPLCDVPAMSSGGKPVEGGHLLFTEEEKNDFLKKEPDAVSYFRPFMSSDDYINGHSRWCLWLLGVAPNIIRSMPYVMERVEAVRKYRSESIKVATREYANYPMQFMEIKQPASDYLMVPRVSSEKRKYIPMGFLDHNVIASDATSFVPDATLYHFGVLTSSVHNAWMRVVSGRLKSDYRYSVLIVYNNFPWPNPTDKQKAKIEQTAQAILDARALYPESSLADLYDEVSMPSELRKAHLENDRAVMRAYGLDPKVFGIDNESLIVAELFNLYKKLTQ